MQHHRNSFRLLGAGLGLLLTVSLPAAGQQSWTQGGGDIRNTRNAAGETTINAGNVGNLVKKWELVMHGDVSATPTVETVGGVTTVYAVDWGGYLYSINGDTGMVNWSSLLSNYTGNPNGSVSRTSPAISGNLLILGDQGDVDSGGFFHYAATASVMAINKTTGALVWRTVVSNHPYSIVTASPVAYNGVAYVGVSSLEENAGFLFQYGYPGFSFRGRVVALDLATGQERWHYDTISEALGKQGYTGAAVWGSTPVVDVKRGSLYVATGNNYSVPTGVGPNPGQKAATPDDHFDSVLALNLKTGALKWARRVRDTDTWDVFRAFVLGGDPDMGPDYDFGSGPNLFTTMIKGKQVDLLGAGQKSGIYWAFDPDSGQVVWSTQVGPGGTGGGIEWGSAVDGNRVYCAISNSDNKPTGLTPEKHGGLWAALDAATGAVQWRTVDPVTRASDGAGGHDYGMVTSANGVVFAGSMGLAPIKNPFTGEVFVPGVPGGMFALNAATGQILWSFPTDGAVNCGPSVVNGTVYWGSGYSHLGEAFGISGTPKLYAFTVN